MVPSQTSSSNKLKSRQNDEGSRVIITQRYGPLTNQQVIIYDDQDACEDDISSEPKDDALSPTSDNIVSPFAWPSNSLGNTSSDSQESESSDGAPSSPVSAPSPSTPPPVNAQDISPPSEVFEEEKRTRRVEVRFTQGFDVEEDDYWAVVARRAERSGNGLRR